MPKQNNELIPGMYRKNFETIGMFFWVQAQQKVLPTMSAKDSIERYLRYIDLDMDIEVAMSSYQRIKKEFLQNG